MTLRLIGCESCGNATLGLERSDQWVLPPGWCFFNYSGSDVTTAHSSVACSKVCMEKVIVPDPYYRHGKPPDPRFYWVVVPPRVPETAVMWDQILEALPSLHFVQDMNVSRETVQADIAEADGDGEKD